VDDLARYTHDPVAFLDRFVQTNELGQPFALTSHQRTILTLAFQFDDQGTLAYDTIVYGAVKKSGKTTINAAVTLWWAFTQEAPNELKLVANDLEQSVSRTFAVIKGLLRNNPELGHSADVKAQTIILSNGTTIQALANDYAGEAGANQGLTSWTELWAFTSESSRRLWEELTPVPTRRNSIRVIDTYAGFEGESELLFGLYQLGVGPDEHPDGQGERLHPDLPVYANRAARLFMYWDHEPRMPWQTPAYYASQRRTLRPSTYLRLHENRWTTGVSTFITGELWDPCVEAARSPLFASDRTRHLFVGVDAAQKHDFAAAVAVYWEQQKLVLATHRIWKPTPAEPLDLEATLETYLRELHTRFRIAAIVVDPWQMARSIATLKTAGLPIRELPQTTASTTAFGQALFDALKGRNLRMYPDAELRQQALNTVAIESTRGWRIAKEKASRKIDAIVALAMAVLAAVETEPAWDWRQVPGMTSEVTWGDDPPALPPVSTPTVCGYCGGPVEKCLTIRRGDQWWLGAHHDRPDVQAMYEAERQMRIKFGWECGILNATTGKYRL
jgi:phage terminase large subunit-like protein